MLLRLPDNHVEGESTGRHSDGPERALRAVEAGEDRHGRMGGGCLAPPAAAEGGCVPECRGQLGSQLEQPFVAGTVAHGPLGCCRRPRCSPRFSGGGLTARPGWGACWRYGPLRFLGLGRHLRCPILRRSLGVLLTRRG